MSDTEQKEAEVPTPPSEPREAGKITKPKSPGRVAAGKKLAEMNRKNKAKKQEKMEEPREEGWDINPGYVIGGLGLAIAAGSLYLQWKSLHAKPAPVKEPIIEEPRAAPKKSRIPEME